MNTNIFGLTKKGKTNTNTNICTGTRKNKYEYEMLSHAILMFFSSTVPTLVLL